MIDLTPRHASPEPDLGISPVCPSKVLDRVVSVTPGAIIAMEKTKAAWKVVSDPFAPESSWVPACAETPDTAPPLSSELILDGADKSDKNKIAIMIGLSAVMAGLAGTFAAQCVHANYFAQHLFGQIVYSDSAFEPWGAFYFWFNQANGVLAYIPVVFSYSMGFLSSTFSLPWKVMAVINSALLIVYFAVVNHFWQYVPFAGDPQTYFTLLAATGIVGSILACILGQRVADNLRSLIKPEKIFMALLLAMAPALLFTNILNLMNSFTTTAVVCLMLPFALGTLTRRNSKATSAKTSILLALSAASPLFLCALLHIPMATWFGFNWSAVDGFSLNAVFRDVFYYLVLPALALALPAGGALFVNGLIKMQPTAEDEPLPFAPAAIAGETCPSPAMLKTERQ